MDQLFSFLMDSSWIFLLGWCLVLVIAYLLAFPRESA
jgi:hypothetical protein